MDLFQCLAYDVYYSYELYGIIRKKKLQKNFYVYNMHVMVKTDYMIRQKDYYDTMYSEDIKIV